MVTTVSFVTAPGAKVSVAPPSVIVPPVEGVIVPEAGGARAWASVVVVDGVPSVVAVAAVEPSVVATLVPIRTVPDEVSVPVPAPLPVPVPAEGPVDDVALLVVAGVVPVVSTVVAAPVMAPVPPTTAVSGVACPAGVVVVESVAGITVRLDVGVMSAPAAGRDTSVVTVLGSETGPVGVVATRLLVGGEVEVSELVVPIVPELLVVDDVVDCVVDVEVDVLADPVVFPEPFDPPPPPGVWLVGSGVLFDEGWLWSVVGDELAGALPLVEVEVPSVGTVVVFVVAAVPLPVEELLVAGVEVVGSVVGGVVVELLVEELDPPAVVESVPVEFAVGVSVAARLVVGDPDALEELFVVDEAGLEPAPFDPVPFDPVPFDPVPFDPVPFGVPPADPPLVDVEGTVTVGP